MRIQCQNCQKIVTADDSSRGGQYQCRFCQAACAVPVPRFAPTVVVGDFVLQEVIGEGVMSTVWRAHQLTLDRPAAVKVLKEDYRRDEASYLQLLREAKTTARVLHPNIVQSYAVGDDDGDLYFAMEYVEGKTLAELMEKKQPLSWQRVLTLLQQISEALDFIWKNQRLVHRNITPDNVIVTRRGVVKLANFAMARTADESIGDEGGFGTPAYISPERLLDRPG